MRFRGLIHLVRGSPIAFWQKTFFSPKSCKNKNKNACRTSQFPAYLASVRRPVYLAFATTSLLAISSATAHAQALAPSTLHLTGPEQETKKDIVQAITKEPAKAITKQKSPEQKTKKDIVQAIAKEPSRVVAKKPAHAIAREPAQAFAIEPVRPMEQQITSTPPTRRGFHFSFKSPEGKKDSAPVITQYYPKRIVYPFAKIDRHIDGKLMQAATIAQERAHAHSRSRCWHYVKEALLASGVIDSRPKSELAKDAAQDLVSNYGFKRLPVNDPFAAPVGSVLVYGANRAAGHVEIRTRDGFVSDFNSKTPSPRPLLGVYAKL
jgi:hypothetical protein